MKTKHMIICLIVIVVALAAFLAFAIYRNDYQKIILEDKYCKYAYGMTPEEFCDKKGAGTDLEGIYTHAKEKDGYLILILSKDQREALKQKDKTLRILQAVLGDTRDIGVPGTVTDEDPIVDSFIKYGHLCGFEISEDFKTIISSPGDDIFYFAPVAGACAKMQIIEGTPSDEAEVTIIMVDENGKETRREVLNYKNLE